MRGDSAYKSENRRRRLKPAPALARDTPAGMRSVCPKHWGLSPRSGRPMSGLSPALAPSAVPAPGDPWAAPITSRTRARKPGRTQSPSQSQEDQRARRRSQSDDMGSRTAQASTSPVQPQLDCGARFATRTTRLPPSSFLIAGYDRRPPGRCQRPSGRAVRPPGRAVEPGRASGFRRVPVEYAKNIFAACKHHFCITCKHHFSRMQKVCFPHALAGHL